MDHVIEHMDELEQDRFEARYFNTMPEAEARAFDAELARDADLAKRYRAFQLAIKGIISTRTARVPPGGLKQKLQQIDRELDGTPENSRSIWLAAAAVAVIIFGIWWVMRPPAYVRLANEYGIEEPGLPVLMNAEGREWDEVMNDLKLGNHLRVQRSLEQMLAEAPGNDTLNYFAGIASAELAQRDRAIEYFKEVPDGSVFRNKARYHRAICELREGRIEMAKPLLEDLAQSGDPQLSGRSRELLDRL